MSSMFRGIKVCLFKQSCQRLAVAAATKAAERAEATGKKMSEKEKLATIKERVASDLKTYEPGSFMPEYWLAFLMCSLPINGFITTRKLGLISLCPIEKQDNDAAPVSFTSIQFFVY